MILFYYGENSFAINQSIKAIKSKYIEKTRSESEIQFIDMNNESDISKLLANLSVMPMFVSSRLLIVKNLGALKPSKEVCQKIVNSTLDSTNLLIIEPTPDKKSSYFKFFFKQKGAHEFKNLTQHQMLKWVQSEVKKIGGSISISDASYLISLCGLDQWRLQNELQKLVAYNPEITKDSINRFVSPNIQQSAFALVDSLLKKDLARTLSLYKKLQIQGEVDQKILGAIIYQYRILLLLKSNIDSLNFQKIFKIAPFAITKNRPLAQKISLRDLREIYNSLVETDLAIKTGELSSTEAMKRLFEGLCRSRIS